MLRSTGHVARIVESRIAFKILTDKPRGNKILRKPGCRWEENIRIEME